MTKSWRPPDWVDANEVVNKAGTMLSTAQVFELGADAMLEALDELARKSPTGTFTIDSRVVGIFEERE